MSASPTHVSLWASWDLCRCWHMVLSDNTRVLRDIAMYLYSMRGPFLPPIIMMMMMMICSTMFDYDDNLLLLNDIIQQHCRTMPSTYLVHANNLRNKQPRQLQRILLSPIYFYSLAWQPFKLWIIWWPKNTKDRRWYDLCRAGKRRQRCIRPSGTPPVTPASATQGVRMGGAGNFLVGREVSWLIDASRDSGSLAWTVSSSDRRVCKVQVARLMSQYVQFEQIYYIQTMPYYHMLIIWLQMKWN